MPISISKCFHNMLALFLFNFTKKVFLKTMISHIFSISEEQLENLLQQYSNIGKNSHVGNLAVEIAKLFLLYLNPNTTFLTTRGIDLTANIDGNIENFEIKGTSSNDVSWDKLKVSSQFCHDNLVNGMKIIRVTNIGKTNMTIHYLSHDEDFILIPELRWTVRKVRNN